MNSEMRLNSSVALSETTIAMKSETQGMKSYQFLGRIASVISYPLMVNGEEDGWTTRLQDDGTMTHVSRLRRNYGEPRTTARRGGRR